MPENRVRSLYSKYKDHQLTAVEQEEWELMLADKEQVELLKKVVDEDWDKLDLVSGGFDLNHAITDKNIRNIVLFPQYRYKRIFKLWPQVASAVAVAVLIAIFYYYKPSVVNDIDPGTNKAYLTLDDGRKISLRESEDGVVFLDGTLTYANGEPLKNAEIVSSKLLTISTPNGGQYKIKLDDGTLVFLNAASSLHYPLTFERTTKRVVQLTGEAYFEVAKDTDKPFYVQTGSQELRVLGTHFMVSAYADEQVIKTTLLEGSVELKANNEKQVLKPADQTSWDGGKFETKRVDVDEETAWLHNEFVFNNESLESIMKKMSRWYDCEVEFQDAQLKNELFQGVVNRFDKMSKVLALLQATTDRVSFKIEKNKIIIQTKISTNRNAYDIEIKK